MSDEIKASLVQNVIDRKFSRANSDFANLMRDKAYSAIDDFKNAFQYAPWFHTHSLPSMIPSTKASGAEKEVEKKEPEKKEK